MKCWTVCVGIGYSQHLMCFSLTTVLVILAALTKWEFGKAGLYLNLDVDVNMCNLLDSPSVHAYVWRPLDLRALLRWKEQLGKIHQHIITCLHHGKFVQSHLIYDAMKQSWCKDKVSINAWWDFHQHMMEFQHYISTSCNACAKVEFPKNLMEFPSLHAYNMDTLIVNKDAELLKASSAGNP